jgi:hypothetical protein
MKNALIFALFTLLLVGCSKNDPVIDNTNTNTLTTNQPLKLGSDSMSIVSGSFDNIRTSNTGRKLVYTSSDTDIVVVDAYGYVKAKLVGITKVKVSDGKDTVVCKVNVLKKIACDEPFLKFGSSKDDVKAYMSKYLTKSFYQGFRMDYSDSTVEVLVYLRINYATSDSFKGYVYNTYYYFKDKKLIKVELNFDGITQTYNAYYYLSQYYYKQSEIPNVSVDTYSKVIFITKDKSVKATGYYTRKIDNLPVFDNVIVEPIQQ